jgi:hypothetical protein
LPEVFIAKLLNETIRETIKKNMDALRLHDSTLSVDSPVFQEKETKILTLHRGKKYEKKLHFEIPAKVEMEKVGLGETVFLLVKKPVYEETVTHSTGYGSGGFGRQQRDFELQVHYLLYDYKHQETVAYGNAAESVSANLFITYSDWSKLASGVVERILSRAKIDKQVERGQDPYLVF